MQDPNPAADNTSAPGFDLDAAEIRVLGVLIEKAFITPDAYPLSINAITTGCNQLTAREPVMSLSEAEVQTALGWSEALWPWQNYGPVAMAAVPWANAGGASTAPRAMARAMRVRWCVMTISSLRKRFGPTGSNPSGGGCW